MVILLQSLTTVIWHVIFVTHERNRLLENLAIISRGEFLQLFWPFVTQAREILGTYSQSLSTQSGQLLSQFGQFVSHTASIYFIEHFGALTGS